ncbi:hypothetical protein CPB86DRAFT_781734 [Serendipita vermifera]|nr:hypothetical protein CPB86DRAFT_781734 [Serendipita vermifera]
MNTRIPFEILWMIFDKYAEADGREDPLEKLLLICKTWTAAAYQYQTLWSSFRIKLNYDSDFSFWYSRIPSRLDLCGDVLLDVDITVGPFIIWFSRINALVTQITSLIIGKDESLVRRWRRLCVEVPPTFLHRSWNKALACPTPNLRFLRIRDLPLTQPILPFAPLLEELQVHGYRFTLMSNLVELKVLKLVFVGLKTDQIEPVFSPPKLSHLEMVQSARNLRFPSPFHSLESVYFLDKLGNDFIETFSAPRLRSICLRVRDEGTLRAIKSCRGIDIKRLDTFGLGFIQGTLLRGNQGREIIEVARELVVESTAVTTFLALERIALRVILLGLQADTCLPTRKRGWFLDLNNDKRDPNLQGRFSISLDRCAEDIQDIRQSVRLPLKDSWDAITVTLSSSPFYAQ